MSASSPVYLDCNAATPLESSLVAKVPEWLETAWGNPSSIHQSSRQARKMFREARAQIAHFLSVDPNQLVCTSGGTESNNLAIKGVYETYAFENSPRNEYIVSSVEHPSVTGVMEFLERKGAIVHRVPVNRHGKFDLDFYKKHLSEKTALVIVMHSNNETGTIFPIAELVPLAHEVGALFHCDAVQSLGKTDLHIKEWDVDFCSFSAHKVYALKGCGVLYQKKGAPLESLIHGSRQERRRRAGTENILPVISLAHVLSTPLTEIQKHQERMKLLRDGMEKQILEQIDEVVINGAKSPRLCNTSSMTIQGVSGETLLMNLDLKGFSVSAGAACGSGSTEPSSTLLALGLTREEAQSTLRISVGWYTAEEELNEFVKTLVNIVNRLRSLLSSE